MSFFNQLFRKPGGTQSGGEKAWNRAEATAWDEKWHALSVGARRLYLHDLKPPGRSAESFVAGTLLDKLPESAVAELVKSGFARVEPGSGKRGSKLVALSGTYAFSTRLRALERYRLLGPTDRNLLNNFIRYSFHGQGELVIMAVLQAVKIEDFSRVDPAIELYVTSGEWPDWALQAIDDKPAASVLEALRKADRPVKLADLPGLVKGVKAKEIPEALRSLLDHLAVFEDLDRDTLEIVVGILPLVRERKNFLAQASQPQPLKVCDDPREVGPYSGLAVNDLRVFLLEVASEAPRLKQDGTLFAKEEPRFLVAFPPRPDWLTKGLSDTPERRLNQSYLYATLLGFIKTEHEDKANWLRLSDRANTWLASGFEEQYARFYEAFRNGRDDLELDDLDDDFGYDDDDDDDFDYDDYKYGSMPHRDPNGETRFYGISLSVHRNSAKNRYFSYYTQMDDETRKALRDSVREAFETLKLGVYYRWDSVLAHLVTVKKNPLNLGGDPSKLTVFVNQRQVPRLPEPILQSARQFVEAFMMKRLLPFDAFRPAIDAEGKLCVARLPRFSGYFGRPYHADKDETSVATRVIVQPDFSVLVIGLDPAPAVEFAPFCDRAGGHAGQGALSFKITRESVVRAAMQGLDAQAILGRIKKRASVDVPANVISEIKEWAGWVRQVNVRPVTVIRCPDSATVDRVISTLGKKAERLGETLAALHSPKLTPAERQKLQDQGILITKQDIVVNQPENPTTKPTPAKLPKTGKKRGRPKKVR